MGNFNGLVGADEEGIVGNFESLNTNGKFLKEFVKTNGWGLINADRTRTTGMFTRSAGGFSTILDYAISSQFANMLVKSLEIDESGC